MRYYFDPSMKGTYLAVTLQENILSIYYVKPCSIYSSCFYRQWGSYLTLGKESVIFCKCKEWTHTCLNSRFLEENLSGNDFCHD